MNEYQQSFDKDALRTLSEKYLAKTILHKEILNFLKDQFRKNNNLAEGQIALLLSERAGKARNSVYKNRNEFTNYSAISFLRYWQAMHTICHENNIPSTEMPSLDKLFVKYAYVIEFINQIAIEDKLEILIQHHPKAILDIFKTFKTQLDINDKKILTLREKEVLKQIVQQPLIQQNLNEISKNKKDEQRERMRRK